MSRYGAAPDPVSWLDRLQAVVRGLCHTPEYKPPPPRQTVRPDILPPPAVRDEAEERTRYAWHDAITVQVAAAPGILPLVLDTGPGNHTSWVYLSAWWLPGGDVTQPQNLDDHWWHLSDHGEILTASPWHAALSNQQRLHDGLLPVPIPKSRVNLDVWAGLAGDEYWLVGYYIIDR